MLFLPVIVAASFFEVFLSCHLEMVYVRYFINGSGISVLCHFDLCFLRSVSRFPGDRLLHYMIPSTRHNCYWLPG